MAATLKVDTIQNASSANPNISLDTNGNASTSGVFAMSSSYLRNRLINGGMQIWQRGTSSTYSSGVNFTADRWWGVTNTASGQTLSQSTSVPTGQFQYSMKMQRPNGNAGINALNITQIIETANCYDLAGQTVTLSFWAKSGANFSGPNLAVYLQTGTVADEGSSTYFSWTGKGFSIGVNQSLTTTWTKYTFSGTIGSSVLEMGVQFQYVPTGTAGADDSVYITGVQLEVGSVATPFERRQYGQELALCQRYLPVFSNAGNASAAAVYVGQAYSTTQAAIPLANPVPTRVPATGIVFSGTAALYTANAGASTNVSIGFNSGSINATQIVATGNAVLVAGNATHLNFAAGAYIYGTGCEL